MPRTGKIIPTCSIGMTSVNLGSIHRLMIMRKQYASSKCRMIRTNRGTGTGIRTAPRIPARNIWRPCGYQPDYGAGIWAEYRRERTSASFRAHQYSERPAELHHLRRSAIGEHRHQELPALSILPAAESTILAGGRGTAADFV